MLILRRFSLLAVGLLIPMPAYSQSLHDQDHDVLDSRPGHAASTTQGPNLAQVEKLIIKGTNAFRARHKRPPLTARQALTHSAQYFADFMARTDKYGHRADGKTPWQRTADFGYDDCIVAENIAWILNSAGFTTQQLADQLLQSWEKSPEHRRNLLDPDLKNIGMGVARSSQTGKYYAVQDFGRPKKDQIVFQVQNRSNTPMQYTVDKKTFSLRPDYTRTHWRCRPPTVILNLPKKETLHPQKGTQYTIQRNQAGTLEVERSPMQPESMPNVPASPARP